MADNHVIGDDKSAAEVYAEYKDGMIDREMFMEWLIERHDAKLIDDATYDKYADELTCDVYGETDTVADVEDEEE